MNRDAVNIRISGEIVLLISTVLTYYIIILLATLFKKISPFISVLNLFTQYIINPISTCNIIHVERFRIIYLQILRFIICWVRKNNTENNYFKENNI